MHHAGTNLYATFQGVVITTDQRSLDVNETVKIVDTTAGADAAESHVVTTKAVDFNWGLLYNGTASLAILQVLAVGEQGTLAFGTEGNSAGSPRYQCQATVTSFKKTIPYAGTVELSVTMKQNADWEANYETLGSIW